MIISQGVRGHRVYVGIRHFCMGRLLYKNSLFQALGSCRRKKKNASERKNEGGLIFIPLLMRENP